MVKLRIATRADLDEILPRTRAFNALEGITVEYAGRDAYVTEIWIDERARGQGVASAVLELLFDALRARDVRALHLEVRPDNPALRLYERHGFVRSRRIPLTRTL